MPDGLSGDSPADDVIPPVAEKILEMSRGSGFAGQTTNYPARSIATYWSGQVPPDVLAYINSKPFGVEVTVSQTARYSRSQLRSGRSRLEEAPLVGALGIVGISAPFDGRGLVVSTTQNGLGPAEVESLRKVSGIEIIEVVGGARASKGYAGRQNDASPWKGGIRIRHRSSTASNPCSAAFAVIVGGTGRLLGARHCDPTGNREVRDGANSQISEGGTAVQQNSAIDSLLIDPKASPATTPRIYRGGYASTTTSLVKNWYSNWPGDPVCSSGASTGEHCGTVYDDSQDIPFNGAWVNVIQVSAPSGKIMGGEGDSGAAMFKIVTSGVQGRGVLLGPDSDHSETTSCGSVDPTMGVITCSRYINYVPISTILNTWNASLEVG